MLNSLNQTIPHQLLKACRDLVTHTKCSCENPDRTEYLHHQSFADVHHAIPDGRVCPHCYAKLAISKAETCQEGLIDISTMIQGIVEFFEGEGGFNSIEQIVEAPDVRGQRQEDECQPVFDHCYVDQHRSSFIEDEYHGTIYFHLGRGKYVAVGF